MYNFLFIQNIKAFAAITIVVILTSVLSGCASNPPERAGEVDSAVKAFVQYGLDAHAEAYLVCVYWAEVTGESKNEVEMRATVVDRIKGSKQVGEKIAFRRTSDSGTSNALRMQGELLYVFLEKNTDGSVFVDRQDPHAIWRYSDELNQIVKKYRGKG